MEKLFISRSDYEAIKNGKDVLIVVEARGESPMYAHVLSYTESLEKIAKKMSEQPEFPMEKMLFGEPFPWGKSDESIIICEPKDQRGKRRLINGIDQDTTTNASSMNEAVNNWLRDKYPDGCPTAPTECDVQLVKDSMKFLKESLNSAAEYADYMARSAQETYDMFHKNQKEE